MGCRVGAKELLMYLIPKRINVVSFDFSGCGKSEGQYITLG